MMLRTHVAIVVLIILLFLPYVSNEFIFIPVVLFACLLPDIDTGFSTIGKFQGGRVIQFLVRHRGLFHSLTFCFALTFFLAVFLPVVALPFFLGYSLHLIADSFTREGIKPFWPYKMVSSWKLRTGSLMETNLFIFFIVLDLLVFIFLVKNVF